MENSASFHESEKNDYPSSIRVHDYLFLKFNTSSGSFEVWSETYLWSFIFIFYLKRVIHLSPQRAGTLEALCLTRCQEALTLPALWLSVGVHPAAGGRETLAPVPPHRAPGSGLQRGGRGQDREAGPRVHVEGKGLPLWAPLLRQL